MSKWCETCYRNALSKEWKSCDSTCPIFEKDFGELAEMTIKYENLKCRLSYLKDCAKSVRDNEDSVFADERSMAEHDAREIVDILLELEP